MKHKLFFRMVALVLVLAMSFQLTSQVFAAVIRDGNGNISIVDADGNVVETKSQEDWEEAYPYGVFAFQQTQINLKEGDSSGRETGKLKLYRLGGTEGRAEAVVTLVPAAAQITEDKVSYANAAGTKDYRVSVENPWPCAQYQPLGGSGAVIRPGGAIATVELGDEAQSKSLHAPVENADSYQWQMEVRLYGSLVRNWTDIKKAVDSEMLLSEEILGTVLREMYTYNFRCFYEVDGVKYCSETWDGQPYVPENKDIPPLMPADFVDDHTRTETDVVFDGKEYDAYSLLVVFADGEWEKEITFTALDDDLHECTETLTAVVTEAAGAEIYSGASTASVAIGDDEPELPSAMGFGEAEIWADRASGKVRIPLIRESEALQYVTGADYRTVDGTAAAGTDYAESSGTALFVSDLDYTYIEIELVDNGVALAQEDSEEFFTVELTAAKGGGSSTLLEGKETVTVRLFNSGAGQGDPNLATALYSPDEEDLTGSVQRTGAIVPGNESVVAEAVDRGESAVGTYSLTPMPEDGISPYTFVYPGTVSFGVQHGGNYWTDYALLANEDVSNYSGNRAAPGGNSDDHEGFVSNAPALWIAKNEKTSSRINSSGWHFRTERGGTLTMTIPNMTDRYSNITINTVSSSDESAWYPFDSGYDKSDPYLETAGSNKELINTGDVGAGRKVFIMTSLRTSGDFLRINHRYIQTGTAHDAGCVTDLLNGYLTRRTIKLPILRIFTSDDDYLKAEAPGLYESIKPDVLLDSRLGGTTSNGSKIYNNSQVTVRMSAKAGSYQFASDWNNQLSDYALSFGLEQSAYWSADQQARVRNNREGTIKLLMPQGDVNSQGYINVVMDRLQSFSLEIAPSVPRLSEDDKTTIDPNQIGAVWDALWAKSQKNGGVTYKYRQFLAPFSADSDGFDSGMTGRLDKNSFSGNGSLFTTGKLKNVRSINFHLDPDDVILVNGVAYAGNEDVIIPANMFLDGNITLYYYDADYVTSENTMLATISRLERYIDLNDDGVVNGTIDPVTGAFVPAEGESEYTEATGTGTFYTLPSLDQDFYSITDLSPRMGADGKYHQIVLKTYYSMLPRCLVVPVGASREDTAEVIPAVVTSVTSSGARNDLSEEQKEYRYLNHGTTGSGKPMYEAAASAVSTVDIPLGGDFNPPTTDENKNIIWEPDWRGNPYPGTEFADPEPIYLDETVLGDRYPVGDVDAAGDLTAEGASAVGNFLNSLQENMTFALCIRETPKPEAAAPYAMTSRELAGLESSRLSSVSTFPDTAGARNLADPNAGQNAGYDSSKSGSSMSEYSMSGQINMPELELGLTDFVAVSTNGQELAISVGFDLFGFSKESDLQDQKQRKFESGEFNGTKSANSDGLDAVKQTYNSLFTKNDGIGKALKDSWKEVKDAAKNSKDNKRGTVAVKGVEVSVAFNLSMVLKWDPIENRFFFNQLMVSFAVGVEFSYTARLTPCPLVYIAVTIGLELEVATGLEATRVKVMAEKVNLTSENVPNTGWSYYQDQSSMGLEDLDEPEEGDFLVGRPGAVFTYTTKEKAIDINFGGKLAVDIVGDDKPAGFQPGIIKSSGEEAVTIKLAEKVDGKDNPKAYTLRFTVLDDGNQRFFKDNGQMRKLERGYAVVDSIVEIDQQTNDVYFAGIQISPELSMEVAVGIGVELLKVELFLNISVGCSFAFVVHDSPDYMNEEPAENGEEKSDYSKFAFNEFSFAATLGLRVTALLFNFELNAVQFTITYDRETKYDEDTNKKNGWNFMWYAANQEVKKYDLAESDPVKVTIILPGELPRNEALYTPEDNMPSQVSTFAFDPSDKTVPFQYSAYGNTGDAFTLGSDLTPGSTYALVTAGGENYLIYTVTDPDQESINQSQLVLSKVQETALLDEAGQPLENSVFGLQHPLGSTDGETFLKLDTDTNGDLDFDAWTDLWGRLHVAWVSYTDQALDAYQQVLSTSDDAIDAMAAAGRHTAVKTIILDMEEGKVGDVMTVAGDKASHGMYYNVSGAEDMVFFAEAAPYTQTEFRSLMNAYQAHYGTMEYRQDDSGIYFGEGDPTVNYQMTMKRMQAQTYGKSFYPAFAVPVETGYAVSRVEAKDWLSSGVQLENAALAFMNGDYYAAYSTSQTSLTAQDEEQTIKKLYLQRLTVEDDMAQPGSAIALRKLVDNTLSLGDDNGIDGVYTNGKRSECYQDPYFANVQFMHGKLGGLIGSEEHFDEQIEMLSSPFGFFTRAETFLLFEMNGNTYVIPQESLEGITSDEKNGSIIPFFTRETKEELSQTADPFAQGAPVVTNVTFGADGNGNITAVYTRGVSGAPGNAVYLTKYDPQSTTWGTGTRLAMRNMDAIEESEAENRSAEETAKVWYDTNGDGVLNPQDHPASFTFQRLRIGLADSDKLLVVAEGSLMQLEAVQQMVPTYDAAGNLTGLQEAADQDGESVYTFQPGQNEFGTYDVKNGVYALSFGVGSQGIGAAALHLTNYDLTPGSEMRAAVSFQNSGDVAIRASQENPAVISMIAGSETVAQWQVTENIRAGQRVDTAYQTIKLPVNLKVGDKLYFTVNEDVAYLEGNAFSQSTITQPGEPDTVGCITVENRVELGYESFDITMVGADADTVTLAADIHVGNRGSMASDQTYLRFQYEKVNSKGETELYPLNLKGHRLSVSDESSISRFGLDERTLENGYLLLRTTQDGKETADATGAGHIGSMFGRTVTGTFTVPKDCYDTGYSTGSLNLRVSIVSFAENGDENQEYNPDNNLEFHSVEPKTLFSTVNSVSMQVGSTLRLAMQMQTSTKTAPAVTVTEITDDGSSNLSVLYYDENRQAIVVMPAQAGIGKIRVADTATNSFHDICYTIEGEGVALNIFDDNGLFTWYDAAGKVNHDAWKFNKALTWSQDVGVLPLRADLAVGQKDYAFTFQTLADSIDLYFMGADTRNPAQVEITSNLADFAPVVCTNSNGTQPVTIHFDNAESVAHTVTVKVLSQEARFDRLEEKFADSLEIQTDPTAPGIYWSRTLPAAASLRQGDDLAFTAYFLDLGGLASVTVNGVNVSERLVADGDSMWALPMSLSDNGSYRFVVSDQAGNTTIRELSVDWFSATPPKNPDAGAPEFTVALVQPDGSPVPDVIPGNMQVMLQVLRNGSNAAATIGQYRYDDPQNPATQLFVYDSSMEPTDDLLYPVSDGIYRVIVRDADTGISSYRFLNLHQRDEEAPAVMMTANEAETELLYQAVKTSGEKLAKITDLRLNEMELLQSGQSGYRFSGSIPVSANGRFHLTAVDALGSQSISSEVVIRSHPLTATADAVSLQLVTEQVGDDGSRTSNRDGAVLLDMSKVSGGDYDPVLSASSGAIVAGHQAALVPAGQQPNAAAWSDSGSFSGLEVGRYDLYIRSTGAPNEPVLVKTMEIGYRQVLIEQIDATMAPDATVTVSARGGAGKLEYSLSTSDDPVWQQSNVFKNVAPGQYVVTVRDSKNPDNWDAQELLVKLKSYDVQLLQTENGSAAVSMLRAAAGQKVEITFKPDPGYTLKHIRVMDENSTNIPVSQYGERRFRFLMPDAGVTVQVTMVKIADATNFTDVPKTSYYCEAVQWAVFNDIIKGTTETTFSPDEECTRAQIVTLLRRAMGYPISDDQCIPFVDVKHEDYFYESVSWAAINGITKGTTPTTFSPNDVCTRAQAVTFLWRAAGKPAPKSSTMPFTDVPKNAYYRDAVLWAAEQGIVKGTSATTFSPSEVCNRAQIVTLLWRQFGL